MPDVNVYTAIGAGLAAVSTGAIITVVAKFLKHIERSDVRQEKFLTNHMSRNTAALERVADRLERVEDRFLTPPKVTVENPDRVEVGT